MEWKKVKISDIATLINGRAYAQPELLYEGKYKIVRVGNLSGGDNWFFSNMELGEDKYCNEGDLLYAWACNFGPYIWHGDKTIFHYHIWKMILDESLANKSYLYYYLKYITPYWLGNVNGSVMVHITKGTMEKQEFPLPPLETQRRIAAILSSLDDKIENNNRINRNLEAQAQALFKSWFVDFEPWGGTMPEDWRETTIGEMCTCYLGGTPSRAKSEYWNGDIPWINSGEVNKYRIVEGSEYITELGLKKSATKLLPKKTTVLAITGATLGQVSLLEIEACANQSVIGILENEKMPYEFIYPLIVNDIDKIILNQTGGAQQHINKDNVESHNIIIPTDEIMAKYKAIQAPLFETIANNCIESHRLAALRDTLLPKLMKGEITL